MSTSFAAGAQNFRVGPTVGVLANYNYWISDKLDKRLISLRSSLWFTAGVQAKMQLGNKVWLESGFQFMPNRYSIKYACSGSLGRSPRYSKRLFRFTSYQIPALVNYTVGDGLLIQSTITDIQLVAGLASN